MFAAAVAISILILRLAPAVSARLGAAQIAVREQTVKIISCGAAVAPSGMLQVYALVYDNGSAPAEVVGTYLYNSAGFEEGSNTSQVYVPPGHYVPITITVEALTPYEVYTVTAFTASGFSASCQLTYSGG